MEVIIENYNLEKSEFWKARNILALKIIKIFKKLILLLVSLFFMWLSSQMLATPAFFYIILSIVIAYFIFLLLRIYFIPYMRYKKNLKIEHKQNLTFNSKGINFIIENIGMEIKDMETKKNKSEWLLPWDKIRSIYANNDLYIFHFNSLLLTVSKRLFKDEAEWNCFKLIVDKYPRIAVQKI